LKAAKNFRKLILTQASEVKIFFMFSPSDVKSISLLYAKTGKIAVSKEKKTTCINPLIKMLLCYFPVIVIC